MSTEGEGIPVRLARLEEWRQHMDRWREDFSRLGESRHAETKQLLADMRSEQRERSELTDERDELRIEKLNTIEKSVQKIELQTARSDGLSAGRGQIFGRAWEIVLAVISGGAILKLLQWIWPTK